MFKLIGGAVVCGFALYGLVKYLSRPQLEVVIKLDDARQGSGTTAGTVNTGAAHVNERTSVDQC